MNSKLRKQVKGQLEEIVNHVIQELTKWGFGAFSRIDLHQAVEEKLHKHIHPAIIISACNPELAYEAYKSNADITSLLPCHAVIREVSQREVFIELVRPTFLMNMIGERKLAELAREIDRRLELVIDSFEGSEPEEQRFMS